MSRVRRVAFALLLMILSGILPAKAFTEEPTSLAHTMTDDRGRNFRIVFPTQNRVFVEGYAERSLTESWTGRASLGDSRSLELSYPEEEIWWQLRLHLKIELESSGVSRIVPLSGSMLRHDKSGFIVVPVANDLHLPAPFDIAFEYALFELSYARGPTRIDRIDTGNFHILLDFVRDPNFRHRVAIGPTINHRMARGPAEDSLWIHSFVPGTGGTLLLATESANGRLAAGATGTCAAAATLLDGQLVWARRCEAEISGEWVILAINDLPLSLRVEVGADENNLSAALGLRWSLPTR